MHKSGNPTYVHKQSISKREDKTRVDRVSCSKVDVPYDWPSNLILLLI